MGDATTAAALADHVDVLIVGAGPAGLMLAAWMARLGVKTRVVDKRGTKIFNGQADGLQCRTLEIFDSFGFGHRAWREANRMPEVCFWNPDDKGVIHRSGRTADTLPGISRFQEVVLHQGRIERFFLDSIAQDSNITIERGILPTQLDFNKDLADDQEAYPITIKLRHLSQDEATPAQSSTSANGQSVQDGLFRSNLTPDDNADLLKASSLDDKANTEETVHAKYVVGADGAHSWVRRQLGFELKGESTDYIWGVLDVVPITDFPDIRSRCIIHSVDSGSVMVIPRENKLVRLYIQLTTTEKVGDNAIKADRSQINPEVILKSAQKIMAPYSITYRRLDWWTAYQIGQRVGTHFSAQERIFLVGDAVHTHSPKAGQGMNVSMQDAYNLGWKIAHVVQGRAKRSILRSFERERGRVAHDLIEFDHKFSRLFSGRPARDIMDEEGISPEVFQQAFKTANMFTSGIGVDYEGSNIIAKPSKNLSGEEDDKLAVSGIPSTVTSQQSLATELGVGKRMPSTTVLNQSDGNSWQVQELLRSNGTWRIILFVGNTVAFPGQKKAMVTVCEALAQPRSFPKRYTPSKARYNSVFEVLTIHAAKRQEVSIFDFPEVLRPLDSVEGWDYWKIYVDDESYHDGHGKAYETFGIDPAKGCVVVLRPDQYVSYVGPLEDYDTIDKFFSGFMIDAE